LDFPNRIYTTDEVKIAIKLISQGHKHKIVVKGSPEFKKKVDQILNLVKIAGYYDFLRTYIRQITEIDGLSQLRETEVEIWANKFAVENVVDAASLFIQKTHHMKEYLEGELYYGGNAEKRSVGKRIEFLVKLKDNTKDETVKTECKRLLQMWDDSSLAY